MIAYLTSTLGGYYKKGGKRIPTQLNTENGLSASLQKHWKDNAKVLIMSSDADDVEKNDGILYVLSAAFPMSGLSVRQMRICDNRNAELVEDIAGYDAVILAGGHVPTQNRFFERIRLKEHLYDFDGIFIGISAGTMIGAEVVYSQPELEGESGDPEYQRFLPSLGVTELMILPHYQDIKDAVSDPDIAISDLCPASGDLRVTTPRFYGEIIQGRAWRQCLQALSLSKKPAAGVSRPQVRNKMKLFFPRHVRGKTLCAERRETRLKKMLRIFFDYRPSFARSSAPLSS